MVDKCVSVYNGKQLIVLNFLNTEGAFQTVLNKIKTWFIF